MPIQHNTNYRKKNTGAGRAKCGVQLGASCTNILAGCLRRNTFKANWAKKGIHFLGEKESMPPGGMVRGCADPARLSRPPTPHCYILIVVFLLLYSIIVFDYCICLSCLIVTLPYCVLL